MGFVCIWFVVDMVLKDKLYGEEICVEFNGNSGFGLWLGYDFL